MDLYDDIRKSAAAHYKHVAFSNRFALLLWAIIPAMFTGFMLYDQKWDWQLFFFSFVFAFALFIGNIIILFIKYYYGAHYITEKLISTLRDSNIVWMYTAEQYDALGNSETLSKIVFVTDKKNSYGLILHPDTIDDIYKQLQSSFPSAEFDFSYEKRRKYTQ